MLNSKGFSSRILRGGWNTWKREQHKREIDITNGLATKVKMSWKLSVEMKPPPPPPADAAKTCMSNRKWRFDCQEPKTRRLCTLCIAQPIQQGHRSAWTGVSETPLKIYICRKLSDSCQDKKQLMCACVCVCFLSHFLCLCLRIGVRNEFNENLFCLLLKNCQLHTQFSFNYAICNLRLWPRQLIITWSHLLHSQQRWVRVTGQWLWVWVSVWVRVRVRGPGRFAPHRAWIFINFHNLCAGCEHCNNLSRSGCCPFAFMAARLFKY